MSDVTGPYQLPEDIVIVTVDSLPEEVRQHLQYEEEDYAITRPGSRTPSKIIGSETAHLLQEFTKPKTIVQAIIDYSLAKKVDPEETFEAALPMLQQFISSRLLFPVGTVSTDRIEPSLEGGKKVAGYEVISCLQVLEDTEVYQVKSNQRDYAVLKLARKGSGKAIEHFLTREEAVLRYLDGQVAPGLFDSGSFDDRPFLVMEWCEGVTSDVAAAELRVQKSPEAFSQLILLCCEILAAYACLHEKGVIHSDIHPRNILVGATGKIRIIDFGLARIERDSGDLSKSPRGGASFFFEPEYAQAFLSHQPPPESTMKGEQYCLAALIYSFLTGKEYYSPSYDQTEVMRQIAEGRVLSFAEQGIAPWPEVEELLSKALSKNPAQRFQSVGAFAEALREVVAVETQQPVENKVSVSLHLSAAAVELLDLLLQRVSFSGPLVRTGIPEPPTASVNFGAAGIAYALYRFACNRFDPALLSLADFWATKAASEIGKDSAFSNPQKELTPEIIGRVSPYHTRAGVHCVQALIGKALGDRASQENAINNFVEASKEECDNLDLTLGKSGTLLACALLLDTLTKTQSRATEKLRELGSTTMQEIWSKLNTLDPIAECRDIQYLGIAHGWAGFAYAALRFSLSAGVEGPSGVEARLEQLALLAEPHGRGMRWPWMLHIDQQRRFGNYMAGWCNGSAGYVFLWTLCHRLFKNDRWLELSVGAGYDTWDGARVGANLCCGVGGRAYALLNLFKHTGDRIWSDRARQLADLAVVENKRLLGTEDNLPDSLYKGEVGVALLLSDLENLEYSAMPFFEEEGWRPIK